MRRILTRSCLRQSSSRRLAFSLLELLAVVTILGIIAVIVIPRIVASSDAAKQSADATNKMAINSAIERYYVDTGSWPTASLKDLEPPSSYDYFPDGLPISPLDGHKYFMDPTTHRAR